MDVYDQSGLHAAVDVFKKVDNFLEHARFAKVGSTMEEHSAALERVGHMSGAVDYTIVDQVEKLPYKGSEIYRRLTV